MVNLLSWVGRWIGGWGVDAVIGADWHVLLFQLSYRPHVAYRTGFEPAT